MFQFCFSDHCYRRIYIVRPSLSNLKYVADQINYDLAMSKQKTFYKILMTPRKVDVRAVTMIHH